MVSGIRFGAVSVAVILMVGCAPRSAETMTAAQIQTSPKKLLVLGSPDEGKLTFLNASGDIVEVVAFDALTHVSYPKWSLDHRRVAFVCSFQDGSQEICTTAWGSSEYSKLTSSKVGEFSPDWDPSGHRIAYIRGSHVWLMQADGSRKRKVPGLSNVGDVTWLDDRHLVVSQGSTDGGNLYSISITGKGRRMIGPGGRGAESEPQVSPDGRTILFIRTVPSKYSDVFAIKLRAKRSRRLTTNCCGKSFPTWSPSGKRIVFFNGTLLIRARRDGWHQVELPNGANGAWVDWD